MIGKTLTGTAVQQPDYEALVAEVYGEDGFTIAFSAPIKDESGQIIGVWANFADFGLVENIILGQFEELKRAGYEHPAISVMNEKGITIAEHDPAVNGNEQYVRDPKIVNKVSMLADKTPGAELSLQHDSGSVVMLHEASGDVDAAGYAKSRGAYDYPGLGWRVLVHIPEEQAFGSIYSTKNLLITISIIALIAIAAVGAVVGTLASRPIKKLSLEISRLSEGDYTKELAGANRTDEIGDMVRSLNGNVVKIRETVTRIKEAATSVNAAASEIASGSADLSMRTEQQASSLEETAASMEEITGTVKANSQNASNANELSSSASAVASAGGKVVEDAVNAMANIEKSSQKISDIIGVIDEIAFQTNLLALNAAVEAARAGDAGKGFAVVASEVRTLAGRSATASKEIKLLINESASQVQNGAQLVNQAGITLKEIVDSVRKVAHIVSEIASASSQQATGIDEINSAVTQMDEVTQQNAALVEENTAAAQSMLEQAKTLEQLVGFFKVAESDEKAPAIDVKPHVSISVPTAAKPAAKTQAKASPNAKLNGHHGHANGHAPQAVVAQAKKAQPSKTYDEGWEEF